MVNLSPRAAEVEAPAACHGSHGVRSPGHSHSRPVESHDEDSGVEVPVSQPSLMPGAAGVKDREFINAFTVDVEDYFHVSGFEKQIDREQWKTFPSRVRESNRRILELLERHQVRATFFVLGWVAEHHPDVVRDIVAAGHEIGSHSYWHRLVYRLTSGEFRRDLRESRKRLEDLTGKSIRSYRAPSFSITARSLWAIEILAEEGFQVDSSIFPVRHDRYGIPHAPHDIHRLATSSGQLTEFPGTVVRCGMNLPISGGGYFRLYPVNLTIRALQHVNRREGRPFMFYIHPWELDPEQPRLDAGSFLGRCRHYVNLHATESKLDRLLRSFRFGTISEALTQVEPRTYEVGRHPYRNLQLAVT